jgi:hypothetical protein
MTGKSKLKIKFKLCFCTQLLIEKLNGAKTKFELHSCYDKSARFELSQRQFEQTFLK